MNRFAILKGITPSPFKDDIAKEIFEQRTLNTVLDLYEARPAERPPILTERQINERQINHMGASFRYPVTQRVRMSAVAAAMNPNSVEDIFLIVRMPSGAEYSVRRDQIHLHQPRTPTGQSSNYELHLNLPDNLASRIIDELHLPEIRRSALNYELQRLQSEREQQRAIFRDL